MSIDTARHGLIWIKGFSASGKTTVARKVEYLLRKEGCSVISLDGDELRKIFGDNWGYDLDSRHKLAGVYFRLCSHLSSQGYTVVISAIAMFDALEEWVNSNVTNAMQVFLDVPLQERLDRDAVTKKIFVNKKVNDGQYDTPKSPDLVIMNYGDTTPDDAARTIVSTYMEKEVDAIADRDRTQHWDAYYSQDNAPIAPSSYAEFVAQQLKGGEQILEVGCGNGRDALFFSQNGFYINAIDRSDTAIKQCKKHHRSPNLDFFHGEIDEVEEIQGKKFDVIYSRFVMHAMPVEEEVSLLQSAAQLLKSGGQIFIECRSINDPLAREGEVISPTERICGHYRRFIIPEELQDRLTDSGFEITDFVEANGLSVYGDDDPVVIRVAAVKHGRVVS